MDVVLLPISDIKPYPGNPRVNAGAVAAVVASLKEFGFRQPIVVDPDMVIIVGHTRFKAAQQLGLEQVPVHIARDLSADQIRAYRIADNQTATIAEWDFDLLNVELNQLQSAEYDLGLLGFDADELAKIMGTEEQDGECARDEVPEAPLVAITQPGDLWILGEHRLLCGDSTNRDCVTRLMDGEKGQTCGNRSTLPGRLHRRASQQ